jgi:hypothetical protein
VHQVIGLASLVVVHIGAALDHHFVCKTAVPMRTIGG